jgi:2-phospho-L-lactate guanylyltransferase (CobY/MobA/RfbA family)
MNQLKNHLSSFSGQAVQGARDVVSSSFYLATDTGPELDLLAQVQRHNVKRFKRHAKAFRKLRVKIK